MTKGHPWAAAAKPEAPDMVSESSLPGDSGTPAPRPEGKKLMAPASFSKGRREREDGSYQLEDKDGIS